ncbi:hypothetical protein PG988_012759 [Apiospora saccharicola]
MQDFFRSPSIAPYTTTHGGPESSSAESMELRAWRSTVSRPMAMNQFTRVATSPYISHPLNLRGEPPVRQPPYNGSPTRTRSTSLCGGWSRPAARCARGAGKGRPSTTSGSRARSDARGTRAARHDMIGFSHSQKYDKPEMHAAVRHLDDLLGKGHKSVDKTITWICKACLGVVTGAVESPRHQQLRSHTT